MRRPARFTAGFRLGCAGLLLGGTGCTVTESGTGVLRVTVATTGGDFDLDGYSVVVDGNPIRRVHLNTQADIRGVPSGTHRVGLEGVASNCTANPRDGRSVLITGGDTVAVAFTVTCIATGVVVTVTSGGLDLDGDGYLVSVDGIASWSVAPNGYTTISRLSPGTHTVGLSGVAANCMIGGANPQSVTVQAGDMAPVGFAASCLAATGVVEVTVATTGIDLDENGYSAELDTGLRRRVTVNGTIAFDTVPSGEHQVRLADAAANCSILGENPRTVHLSGGATARDTARVTFGVRCVGTEVLQVEVATAGVDFDPNGYTLYVDARPPQAIAVNGTTNLERLGPGDHRVRLGDITGNCSLEGDAERVVTLQESTTGTVRIAFRLTCAKVAKIAFQNGSSIVVTYVDGSNGIWLTEGYAPAWSPDGGKIAFVSVYCDYYYYDCRANGLAVMTPDAGGFVQLTSDATDGEPAWKPDGSQIAFTRRVGDRNRLYLMNADGSGPATIPIDESVQGWNPAWSPDGARLAFSCVVEPGNSDVCLVNPDGSGLLRLTSDPAEDAAPAWKPDGSRIAFTTIHQLAVMNPDGSGATRVGLLPSALDPAWSPDGTTIVFAVALCGYPCQSGGLFLIAPDGTGLSQLTAGPDYAPAWRP